MESVKQNKLLTEVGRGTPMGELMQSDCSAKIWSFSKTAKDAWD
ncbi:MAG: hypothetical protein RL281_1787 [Pseudomonadota bacterium]